MRNRNAKKGGIVLPHIGNMNQVKIFVLYLMKNIRYPLDYVTINDIVMQTDFILYLDFAVAFHEMLDLKLIEEVGKNDKDEPLYAVTKRGIVVAEELGGEILPSILDKSLSAALRYLDFKQRNVTVECDTENMGDRTYLVTMTLKEDGKILLSTKISVNSEHRARQMRETFRDRPEVIYRGIIALLSGNVDFLFDKPVF